MSYANSAFVIGVYNQCAFIKAYKFVQHYTNIDKRNCKHVYSQPIVIENLPICKLNPGQNPGQEEPYNQALFTQNLTLDIVLLLQQPA